MPTMPLDARRVFWGDSNVKDRRQPAPQPYHTLASTDMQHSQGDRCHTSQLVPSYFAEMAASATGPHRFRFHLSCLQPSPKPLELPASYVGP